MEMTNKKDAYTRFKNPNVDERLLMEILTQSI